MGQLQAVPEAILFPTQWVQLVVVHVSHFILKFVQGGHVSNIESLCVSGGQLQEIPNINLLVPRQWLQEVVVH